MANANDRLMRERAVRLAAYLESSCTKYRSDSLAEAGVDLEADPPVVPHRFVTNEWDGSETYVQFADTLDEIREVCAGLGGGESVWLTESVVDLDTGNSYQVHFAVTLAPLAWIVRMTYAWSNDVNVMRFESEDAAQRYVDSAADDERVTILDGPTRAWIEDA